MNPASGGLQFSLMWGTQKHAPPCSEVVGWGQYVCCMPCVLLTGWNTQLYVKPHSWPQCSAGFSFIPWFPYAGGNWATWLYGGARRGEGHLWNLSTGLQMLWWGIQVGRSLWECMPCSRFIQERQVVRGMRVTVITSCFFSWETWMSSAIEGEETDITCTSDT